MAWKDPALLDLLRDSPVNYLLFEGKDAAQRLAADAAAKGLRLTVSAQPAEAVELVKGFDPMADRGMPPFENADSIIGLAEKVGIGARDLSRIDVAGFPLSEPTFDFAALRRQRRSATSPRTRG